MTARGHVHNGTVILDSPVSLPEGAEVEVYFRSNSTEMPKPMARLTVEERSEYAKLHPSIQRMVGILPEDFDWEREREAYLQEKYGPF